jgi:hypothetical protein
MSFSRAERRRWQKNVLRFAHACSGVCETLILPESGCAKLLLAALAGEPHAHALMASIATWMEQAASGRFRCLNCDVMFAPPDIEPSAFAVSLPFAGGHDCSIVTGICSSCAGRDDLREVALQRLRAIFPDAYSVKEGGHG